MSERTLPTEEDFILFQKYFADAVDHLGGFDYRIDFEFKPIAGYAEIEHNAGLHVAVVRLASNDWGTPVTSDTLAQRAQHEALHLLLADFSSIASDRYASQHHMVTTEEALVRRLEWLIFDNGF